MSCAFSSRLPATRHAAWRSLFDRFHQVRVAAQDQNRRLMAFLELPQAL
jgi:hypothetical protein